MMRLNGRKVASQQSGKLMNVIKMFENQYQEIYSVSVMHDNQKGLCTLAANPVNDIR